MPLVTDIYYQSTDDADGVLFLLSTVEAYHLID